jgi:hypothetical protein
VVLTDLFRAIPDWRSIAEASAQRSPLRTVVDPEDVAEGVTSTIRGVDPGSADHAQASEGCA